MSKKTTVLLVLAAFSLCLVLVLIFMHFTRDEAERIARLMPMPVAAAEEKYDPDVALAHLRAPGLDRLLSGWTYNNQWEEGDWRVDNDMEAYGARSTTTNPDVLLQSTTRDGDAILWVSYHGRDRYVRKSDPNFSGEVKKIIIDMARVRLAEYRVDMARREGHR